MGLFAETEMYAKGYDAASKDAVQVIGRIMHHLGVASLTIPDTEALGSPKFVLYIEPDIKNGATKYIAKVDTE